MPTSSSTRRSVLPALGRVLALGLMAGCSGFAQSSGPKALAIMPGVVNRPDNKSLRFAMLKYGLEEFCRQMTKRGAPLKLTDDTPTIGRFYPARCETRVIDEEGSKSFLVQFLGSGYAWTNITHRIGFDAAGVVEYNPDFLLEDATMYLYFRTKHIGATSFQAGMIENPGVNLALVMAPGGFADKFGQEVVASELTRGFTVLRQSDGGVDFGLGIIDKGKKPFHPYEVRGTDKVTLANERLEVHAGQREFLGPFEVDGDGRALFFTIGIDGAQALDVFLLPKDSGDVWLSQYIHQPATAPPPYPPLMQDVVAAVAPWRKALPVAKGQYYLVLDNTPTAGRVSPEGGAFDDRAALVNYAVQLGDAP
jgi:hypothetical protein